MKVKAKPGHLRRGRGHLVASIEPELEAKGTEEFASETIAHIPRVCASPETIQ